MGGMIAATFIGIFMVPSFYVAIRRLSGSLRGARQPAPMPGE